MTSVPESIPSEQDVQAYADGRLSADREHSVSAYLARRPAEARRVAFYARVNAQLRNHFPDDGLAAAVLPLSAAPAALSVPPAQSTPALAAVPASRRRASRFGYRLAAAALLALLAAAVLPRLLRVPDHRLDTAAYAMLLALPGIDPAMGAPPRPRPPRRPPAGPPMPRMPRMPPMPRRRPRAKPRLVRPIRNGQRPPASPPARWPARPCCSPRGPRRATRRRISARSASTWPARAVSTSGPSRAPTPTSTATRRASRPCWSRTACPRAAATGRLAGSAGCACWSGHRAPGNIS